MTNTIDERLRIATGFRPDEHDRVRDLLGGKLERRLSRWPAEQVDLEISLKERDTDQQQVTLEAWIAVKGRTRFVATSTKSEVDQALVEVRDDLHRQIDKFLTKRESRRQ